MSLNDNTMFVNKLTSVISGLRYTVGNTNWTHHVGYMTPLSDGTPRISAYTLDF